MFTNKKNRTGVLFGAAVLGCFILSLFESNAFAQAEATNNSVKTTTVKTVEGNWGNLSGRFVYEGTPPQPRFLEVSCNGDEAGSLKRISDESLIVQPGSRGVKNIVVFARKVPRIHESYQREADIPIVLEQKDCVFAPHVLAMQANQTLRIINNDSCAHVCLYRPRRGMEEHVEVNVLLSPGRKADFHFAHQENEPTLVTCSLHPWMRAYVIARINPYFAVTNEFGTFFIANLPAGEEIEFQVWHEKARGHHGALLANPEWTKGRFRVTIPRGDVKNLGEIKISPSAFGIETPGR